MRCGCIIFGYLLTRFCTYIEGSPPSLAACSISIGQGLRQCGDDFFDASLCLNCGCCFQRPSEMHSASCYVPPGSEGAFQLSQNCTRSLKSLLGKVLLLNDSPSKPQSPVTFYILLERYSPHLQISLRTFGSSVVEPKLLPFSRDSSDLPSQVKKQLRDLESGAEPFFYSYASVTYPLPGIHDAVLLIHSRDGLDGLIVESKVSVKTGRRILLAMALQSAVFFNRGPYTVGEESVLGVVLVDIDPDIELIVAFGDNSEVVRRGGLSFLLGAFPEKPGYGCLFTHRYSSGGEYLAKAVLVNPNPRSVISQIKLTTRVRIKCSFPRVEVTGGSVFKSDAKKKKRNETLTFQIWVIQDCTDKPVVTEWTVLLVDQDENVPENEVMTDRKQTNKLEVKFPPYTLDYGLYILKIMGKVPYHNPQNQLIVTEAVWFEVVTSMPVAVIEGPLLAGDWEIVSFDSSNSYDPDVSWHSNTSYLSYTWYCLAGQWNITTVQEQMETAFRRFEGCYYPGCTCQDQPDTSAGHSFIMTWPQDDYYRQTIPAVYTIALRVLTSSNRSAFAVKHLMFFSDASRSTQINQVTIPLEVIEKIPDVDVACLSNCLEHMDHSKPLVLYAYCRNCLPQEPLTYEWDFQPASENYTLKRIDWKDDTLNGNQKASLIVNAKTFENITEDESYQFFVTVTRLSGKQAKVGFSCYFAKYNTDYSIGASQDNSAIRLEQQLHMSKTTLSFVALLVLNFEWDAFLLIKFISFASE